MNSVFSNRDEESDEERVVYLDISDGIADTSAVALKDNSTIHRVKRKPLFQYRKYKGDVSYAIVLLMTYITASHRWLMMMMVML